MRRPPPWPTSSSTTWCRRSAPAGPRRRKRRPKPSAGRSGTTGPDMPGPDMAIAAERKRVAQPTGSWVARTLDNPGVLAFLFMLPAATLLLVFLTYPLGLGIWLGFTDTKIGRPGVFIGLENFISLADDSVFWLSVFNTVLYTSVATVLKFGLGLYLALLLNNHLPFK